MAITGQNLFGIFLVCKNNYAVLDLFFQKHNYHTDDVLVLDLGSTPEQLAYGKQLCEKYSARLDIARSKNMQDNLQQACHYFEGLGINWIFYCHQDIYPLSEDWRDELNNSLSQCVPGDQGVIGINVYHDHEIGAWDRNNPRLMTTARSPLELGNGYYDSRPGSRANYTKFEPNVPFLVEIPFWSSCVVDASAFRDNIEVDNTFVFFHAFDDLCFQFLSKNVPNFVLPKICFAHDQNMKCNVGVAKNSSTSGTFAQITAAYGKIDFDHWWSKWGFQYKTGKRVVGGSYFASRVIDKVERISRRDISSSLITQARQTYAHTGKFRETLIGRFYQHDPSTGPLDYFNLVNRRS